MERFKYSPDAGEKVVTCRVCIYIEREEESDRKGFYLYIHILSTKDNKDKTCDSHYSYLHQPQRVF